MPGLLQFFGLNADDIGKGSVQEAHATVVDAITRVKPILDDTWNRATIFAHTLLNRFEIDVNCKIKLNPWNVPPKED